MRLLLSTYDALLLVGIGQGDAVENVEIVDTAFPVYFGITRAPGRIYTVARNLTIHQGIRHSGHPTNVIEERDPESLALLRRWTHPGFHDLHQIRRRGRHLFVLTGKAPSLLVFDRHTSAQVAAIDLNSYVPPGLQHPPPPQHPTDHYHFNSIVFSDGRMRVLAHNWHFGSFILEFDENLDDLLGGTPALLRVRADIGFESHDILSRDGELIVVNSRGNALLDTCHGSMPFPVEGFPRGLAATPTHLFVASGRLTPRRDERELSETRLMVIDREARAVVTNAVLGDFGNSNDITFLDGLDLTDAHAAEVD